MTSDGRLNEWGAPRVAAPLPPAGAAMLDQAIGPGTPPRDADLATMVAAVGPSRIAAADGAALGLSLWVTP